ncbi:hypothetical protein L484_024734 [Morus notabilis]|uniref:GUN4-like domain-containing protein n=1 Tax=Morus notabilis TaxID=981085 RepID=W9RTA4_9ROSA|nr:tetrapyrrole-binding protein, chloroplastic [Morus notabilis]EXB68714.1 hypothetical protein L484_024734 [Morus notabilis]
MATNTLHSIPHNHHSLLKRHHSSDAAPSFFLKPTTTHTTKLTSLSSSTLTFSLSPNATTTTSSSFSAAASSTSLDLLRSHLAAADFRQADEETRRLVIALAGDAAQQRGYVFFSEVQYIPESDLKAIDELWRTFSDGKFGYSVQKKIFNKVDNDFTRFFIKVRWMKKLDSTEFEHYNYRSFPTEFVWEINGDTPEGHLPLTNALRGTRLLNSILSHPAFNDVVEEKAEEEEEEEKDVVEGIGLMKKGGTSKRVIKSDYSF